MARADYAHWNEDADFMWWQEEGRHVETAPDPDDFYDDNPYRRGDDFGIPGEDFCGSCGSLDADCGCGDDGWKRL